MTVGHAKKHVFEVGEGLDVVELCGGDKGADGRPARSPAIGSSEQLVASPWQNGFAERLIGSIRREWVNHILVLGEAHLRRILRDARYYNDINTSIIR